MTPLELEAGFVGLVLVRAEELDGVLPHLDHLHLEPSHLTGRHRRVFIAIRRLHERGARIGFREVVDELQAEDDVRLSDLVGWANLCMEFDLAVPSRIAEAIREHTRRERIACLGEELIAIASTWPIGAEELTDRLIRRLSEAA